MKNIIASLSVLILSAWTAPAGAVVILELPGFQFTLVDSNPHRALPPVDGSGFTNIQLSFSVSGANINNPCDGARLQDCFGVALDTSSNLISGFADVPSILTNIGLHPIAAGDASFVIWFVSLLSGTSMVSISDILVTGDRVVPEPAAIALIGFALAGMGVARRRRKLV